MVKGSWGMFRVSGSGFRVSIPPLLPSHNLHLYEGLGVKEYFEMETVTLLSLLGWRQSLY